RDDLRVRWALRHPPGLLWREVQRRMTTQTEQLWGLIEPYLAAERLELDDLELVGQGRGRILRVYVDGEGVDIDRLADVSGGISRLLDAESDLEGSYQLEDPSPGPERKLKRPDHYLKTVGREEVVKMNRDGQTQTQRGDSKDTTEDRITLEEENGEHNDKK